jgi:hypothetical protein
MMEKQPGGLMLHLSYRPLMLLHMLLVLHHLLLALILDVMALGSIVGKSLPLQ